MAAPLFTRAEIRKRHATFMPVAMAGMAVIFLVAGWGLFVLKTSFGVNVIGMEAKRLKELHSTTPNTVELAVAVLATVAAPILLYKAWSARHLALHGLEAVGRVTNVSMLRKAGASPITVEYQAGGRSYTTKKDYVADGIEVGEPVCVVFDERKPSRCFVIWNERPAAS